MSADLPISSVEEKTPLHALHVGLGAKMAGFAGYDMPIHYPSGIMREHLHTRESAGLFDVSHMGQAILSGKDAGRLFESLVPGDIQALGMGRMRYTQLLDAQGHILDDLMVTRLANSQNGDERLFLVVNAGTKQADFAHVSAHLPALNLTIMEDHALIALQGPKAAQVLARFFKGCETMAFMSGQAFRRGDIPFFLSRCGYTGEDGFEISLPSILAESFAQELLAQPEVAPIGLGARDSLRLEAGLCLYGHDINAHTTPIEAGLIWSISKRRRMEGGFPGAAIVQQQISAGPERLLAGILPEGRAPAREGADITDLEGRIIGHVTSGGFGPSLARPIAMGMVEAAFAKPGTSVLLVVRGKPLPASITSLPFVPHRYFKRSDT